MSERATGFLLWLIFVCVLPLPFFLVVTGWVPVWRLFQLSTALVEVRIEQGGQGAIDFALVILLTQAVVGTMLWGYLAKRAAALLPNSTRMRLISVLMIGVVSFTLASQFDVYGTPFRQKALRGTLLEVAE